MGCRERRFHDQDFVPYWPGLNNEFVDDRTLLRYIREVVRQAELGILGLASAIAEVAAEQATCPCRPLGQ
jgi:hypothetical protein